MIGGNVDKARAPEASVNRLALYHCYLGEVIRSVGLERITSRTLARDLNVKDETVRRDLSLMGGVGRPGAGYDTRQLYGAIQVFLGLREDYPIVKVGTAQMLSALSVVFPAHSYGVATEACFSELPEDAGKVVEDCVVKHVTEIPSLDPSLGLTVALVACSPGWVKLTLELLHQAGVRGVLLLTPSIRTQVPEGMQITQLRMPCDIKTLACRCASRSTVKA